MFYELRPKFLTEDVIENAQIYSRPYFGHGEFGHQLRWCCNNIVGWCCKTN